MYSQLTPPPVTPPSVTLSGASPSPRNSPAGADPRSPDLAQALASLRDQAKTIRTPIALASDLLAEALLQRRYRPTAPDAAAPPAPAPSAVQTPAGMTPGRAQTPGGAPAYAPQGQPGPLQVASSPQAAPTPSPSPGVPPPSAPAGTASPAPAAASQAAGAAGAPLAPGTSPTLVDALKAYFAAYAPTLWRPDLVKAPTPADQDQGQGAP